MRRSGKIRRGKKAREGRSEGWRIPPKAPKDPGRESYISFIRRIFDRDDWTCKNPFCGSKRNQTCHHIKKRSLGGKHEDGNCVTICMECHRANEDGRLRIAKTSDSPMVVSFDDRRYGMVKEATMRQGVPYKKMNGGKGDGGK